MCAFCRTKFIGPQRRQYIILWHIVRFIIIILKVPISNLDHQKKNLLRHTFHLIYHSWWYSSYLYKTVMKLYLQNVCSIFTILYWFMLSTVGHSCVFKGEGPAGKIICCKCTSTIARKKQEGIKILKGTMGNKLWANFTSITFIL